MSVGGGSLQAFTVHASTGPTWPPAPGVTATPIFLNWVGDETGCHAASQKGR